MEAAVQLWVSENDTKLKNISLKIATRASDSVKMEIDGYFLEMVLPSDNDSFIMVSSASEYLDPSLTEQLQLLNEKLERLQICKPDCIRKALDFTVQALQRYKNATDSYLGRLGVQTHIQCQKALFAKDALDSENSVLAWCSVSVDSSRYVVTLSIDMRGILFESESVARALGFRSDGSDYVIELSFNYGTWLGKFFTERCWGKLTEVRTSYFNNGSEKNSKNIRTKLHRYGPDIMVRELITGFLNSQSVDSQEENCNNLFLGLLLYVGKNLKMLKNQCIMCKKELPPLSRLWYCEADLCLYRFEEVGLGAPVLEALQDKEVAEFEIFSAHAACKTSSRDVFEPYPTLFLKSNEIRDRAGFFGEEKQSRGGDLQYRKATHLENKNLNLLNLIISSFPPVEEMQSCKDETELMLKLSLSQQETKMREGNFCDSMWTSYSLLRFILFTNRSLLKPLRQPEMFSFPNSYRQFMIVYDSQKEQYFSERRKQNGSAFAFHGSNACNWYSIIRNGLRCLSKTPYMAAGMAYGEGIYLSQHLNISAPYATTSEYKNEIYSVVAICEVVLEDKGKEPLVIPKQHEKDICVRYLIVSKGKCPLDNSLNIRDKRFLGKCDLLQHYMFLRDGYVGEREAEGLARRQWCRELLESRRSRAQIQ